MIRQGTRPFMRRIAVLGTWRIAVWCCLHLIGDSRGFSANWNLEVARCLISRPIAAYWYSTLSLGKMLWVHAFAEHRQLDPWLHTICKGPESGTRTEWPFTNVQITIKSLVGLSYYTYILQFLLCFTNHLVSHPTTSPMKRGSNLNAIAGIYSLECLLEQVWWKGFSNYLQVRGHCDTGVVWSYDTTGLTRWRLWFDDSAVIYNL